MQDLFIISTQIITYGSSDRQIRSKLINTRILYSTSLINKFLRKKNERRTTGGNNLGLCT